MPSGQNGLNSSLKELLGNKVWIHVDRDALSFDKEFLACVGIPVKNFVLRSYFIIAVLALQDLTKRFICRVSHDDGMVEQIADFFDFSMTFEIFC